MIFRLQLSCHFLENECVHVQGYCYPLLSFFIGLGQCSMFLTYNDKNNEVVRTVSGCCSDKIIHGGYVYEV